jgi:hypothetical protein
MTIREWFPEPYCRFRGKIEEPESADLFLGKKGNLQHLLHLDFFGIANNADHDRLQSYECAYAWLEEPCALRGGGEFISSGVSEDVIASTVTCMRNSPRPSFQISMNPPSLDHYIAQIWRLPGWETMAEAELEMPEEQLRARESIRQNSAVFMMPPGENAAEKRSPGYLARQRDILLATGNQSLFSRLVEGRPGSVDVGVRVTPEFTGAHIVQGLEVIENVPFYLSFDYGLTPACLVAQVSPLGYLHIVKCWWRTNEGMKQLLEGHVQPWLVQQPVKVWSYMGGVEATQREQSDSEESALKMIMRILGPARYQKAPVSWSARREAMKEALSRYVHGVPWVRVHPEGAAWLVRALDGGWQYELRPNESIKNEDQAPKGKFSHAGDAFAALCAVLLRKTDAQARGVQKKVMPVRYPTRGVGYAGSRTGV